MQDMSTMHIAVCLLFGVLFGNVSGCGSGRNDYVCQDATYLSEWGTADDGCEVLLRQHVPNPFACQGCTVHSGTGYIEVWTPEGGSYRCDYGNERETKACEAYCVDTEGSLVHGSYVCYPASDYRNSCECDRYCVDNNL